MRPLINIPSRNKSDDTAILTKAKKKVTPATKKSGGGISSKIARIVEKIEQYLGKYKDEYGLIEDEQTLSDYIDAAIEFGEISIDTETTGLDPMRDTLVGISIYVPGQKPSYIPVNHISYITGAKSKHNVDIEILQRQFQRLVDSDIGSILFNATFDLRMLIHGIGVRLSCVWESYLAARCMNENEPSNSLKPLHQKYVLKNAEEEFKFDELFKNVNFALVPISSAYLYAAHDAKDTYELCEYQRQFLYYEPECEMSDRNGMNGVSWVYFNIELPCVDAVLDMEETGIAFDFEYNAELKEKYHKMLDEREQAFHKSYEPYSEELSEYADKLDNPINIDSPKQLAIIFYDVLGCDLFYDKKKKAYTRSTSEDALKGMDNDIAKALLAYRSLATIVSTFIDKLPECVFTDGRVHCKFNQYGADTGRFSSSDPNMQNIPSHNKDIRKMFKATDGYVIMSADYSQQEVKGMAQMCHDEGMIQAFREGKDFYAAIASVAFNYPYEDCLEFQVDENGEYVLDKNGERITNPEGKERRASAKSILLGINYGRGAASIAEQIGCAKEDAERIKEDVFRGFPAIEKFEKESFRMVEELGYITTLWGRKRRLPAMLLPDYSFEWKKGASIVDDPLNFDDDEVDDYVPDSIVKKYLSRLKKAWKFTKRQQIMQQAEQEDGIIITDNTKNKDYTKVVNARIQGTAADMSKLAMIALQKDERLKELGFRMLIPIHDEILAECPIENARECKERFAKIMSEAPGDRFEIPINCDVTVSDRWYGDSVDV